MTAAELKASTADPQCLPSESSNAIQALWCAASGDWNRAHELCQLGDPVSGAWVHAYLHREEGDLQNARYWYSRAGRPEFLGSLEDEWLQIAGELLRE